MTKVLVTARSFINSIKAKKLLEKENYDIIYNTCDRPLTENELLEVIENCNAIIAGVDEITEKVIAKGSPALKIIARHGVGFNNIDLDAAKKYGVIVTNTPSANSAAVAELAIALMLATARQLNIIDHELRKNLWHRRVGMELNNKVLGVVGLGSIGSEVVKRAVSFNMKILAFDKYKKNEMIEKYDVSYVPLDELLKCSDIISLHLTVTAETKGLINEDKLKIMKKSAILINTARGELIVEEDLYNALKNRRIAAAGLDSFVTEPLKDSPLFTLENIILTSHIGAYTLESIDRMATMAALEVIRVLRGDMPKNPVY
jgi:D-3-phosphoglycerate dehydrogenase